MAEFDFLLRSLAMSFGDASKAQGSNLEVVEVLAAVDESISDYGVVRPHGEIKYSYYESLLKRKSQPLEVSKWQQLLYQAEIYIFDPAPAVKKIFAEFSYEDVVRRHGAEIAEQWAVPILAEETVRLMPQVWLNVLDLVHEGVLWEVGTIASFYKSLEQALNDSKRKFVNLRRLLLQSQHLFRHALHHRPRVTLFDGDEGVHTWEVPVGDIISSIAPQVILDEGHAQLDLPVLDQARLVQRARLNRLSRHTKIPDHIPGRVSHQNSRLEFRIQVADVAAGWARELYAKNGAQRVIDHFRTVHVNGTRISAPTSSLPVLTRSL